MFNYKYHNENVEGTLWKRAASIIISNELGQVPTVTFDEQIVSELGGEVLSKYAGSLDLQITEEAAAEQFPLLDMAGNEIGAEINIGQIAAMLFSAYVHFAEKRDATGTTEPERSPVEIFNNIPQ